MCASAGNGIPCRRQKRDRCIEFGGVASDYKDANVPVDKVSPDEEVRMEREKEINVVGVGEWRRR